MAQNDLEYIPGLEVLFHLNISKFKIYSNQNSNILFFKIFHKNGKIQRIYKFYDCM